MCDEEMLEEYGLLGAFDTVASLKGEDFAILLPSVAGSFEETSPPNDHADKCDGSHSSEESLNGISYAELQQSSQNLACQLYFRFGARRNDRIMISCGGSTAAEIVGMLACIRIGAIFVPVDESWLHAGAHGVRSIISDCDPRAAVVVGEKDSCSIVTAFAELGFFKCAMLMDDGSLTEYDASVSEAAFSQICSLQNDRNDRLYVLYTSGSTGLPKGVLGSHVGLINRICWQYKKYPWDIGEVSTRRTALTFVDSMAEIFSPLLAGVQIWTPPLSDLRTLGLSSIALEGNLVGASRITVLPSQLFSACVTDDALGRKWKKLRYVFVSGEECRFTVVDLFRSVFPHARLINLYGSTEVSGDVTFAELYSPSVPLAPCFEKGFDKRTTNFAFSDVPVPIGHCIPGNCLFVVSYNDNINLYEEVPPGTIGELIVAGKHVSHGYFNRSAENEEKFFQMPCSKLRISDLKSSKFDRIFFTGDLCEQVLGPDIAKFYNSMAESGPTYLYRGRKDRVVKIRGVRVDLDETERAVYMALGVGDGVSVICANNYLVEGEQIGLQQIIMFIEIEVMQRLSLCSGVAVKNFLKDNISPIAFPAHVIPISEIPRTTSKKISRVGLHRIFDDLRSRFIITKDNVLMGAVDKSGDSHEPICQLKRNIVELYLTILPDALIRNIECLNVQASRPALLDLNSINCEIAFETLQNSSFYDMGGDSISAVVAFWKLKKLVSTLSGTLPEHALSMSITALVDYINASSTEGTSYKSGGEEMQPPDVAGQSNCSNTGKSKKRKLVDTQCISSSTGHPRKELRVDFDMLLMVSSSRHNRNIVTTAIDHAHASTAEVSDTKLSITWSVNLSRCVDSSPLVVCFSQSSPTESALCPRAELNLMYVGSHHGDFVAVDISNGISLWRCALGEHIEGAAVSGVIKDTVGTRCRTVIYVPSYVGADLDGTAFSHSINSSSQPVPGIGTLSCVDALTGEILWMSKTDGEIKGSPAFDDSTDLVFVGSHDCHVYCFSATFGNLLCKLRVEGAVFAGPIKYNSCSTGDDYNLVIADTCGFVYGITVHSNVCSAICSLHKSEESQLMTISWKFAFDHGPIFASPLVRHHSEGTEIVLCTATGLIFCIEPPKFLDGLETENNQLWCIENSIGPIFSSPCPLCMDNNDQSIPSHFVVGSHDGRLRCFCITKGDLMWLLDLGSAIFSSPSCYTSLSHDGSSKHMCIVATTSGRVVLVELLSEYVCCEIELPAEIYSSPVIHGGKIYVGCRDDNAYCIDASIL